MVGDGRLARMVRPFQQGLSAHDYPNDSFDDFLTEIAALYGGMFTDLQRDFPQMCVLCHGYDWVVPQRGRWLGAPLASRDISDPTLQADIVRVLIDRFNAVLIDLADQFPNVRHIDCRSACAHWHDELHPNSEGFKSVAARFATAIRQARTEFIDANPAAHCPGPTAFRSAARDLTDGDFRLSSNECG